MNGPPTFLSLFAGIGGFDLALERTGWRCVAQCEVDPFCQRVLAARFPDVPRQRDVRDCGAVDSRGSRLSEARSSGISEQSGGGFGHVDLLVGGFPCQDFSVAGRRAGLVGYRGTLFWEIVRIAKEIHPTWGLFENVPGLLSSHRGRDFWAVLQGLRDCWPAVGWRILDSRYFGVPQRRRRVFFVCGPSEAAVASVLFEPEGGGGHPAAGGEAGAGVARTIARGSSRSGYRYDPNGEDFVVTATLNSGGNDGGFRTEPSEHLVTGTLPAASGEKGSRKHGHGFGQQEWESGFLIARPLRAGRTVADAYGDEGNIVRRLTPLECERLQAFPDGWTCLCQPLNAYAADPDQAAWNCRCPDGPRYRALGNAVTVSVVEWIGRRLMEAHFAQA